jgi:methylmalonyl-CoA mutase N-terminal domain/subunit
LIAYETGAADTADPLAGSYYLEELTREIVERAEGYIRKIDDMGGAAAAIEKGYIQREIQESAYRYQREIEKNERVVVGLNRFQMEEKKPTNLLRVDPEVRVTQADRLKKLRAERDGLKVEGSLKALRQAAEGDANLMPPLIAAVKAYATLGEICDVLREVFGEYQQVKTLG